MHIYLCDNTESHPYLVVSSSVIEANISIAKPLLFAEVRGKDAISTKLTNQTSSYMKLQRVYMYLLIQIQLGNRHQHILIPQIAA